MSECIGISSTCVYNYDSKAKWNIRGNIKISKGMKLVTTELAGNSNPDNILDTILLLPKQEMFVTTSINLFKN